MRSRLLDTPLLSATLLNRPGAVSLVAPWIDAGDVPTSIIAYGEVNDYIAGRPDYVSLHAALLDLLRGVPPLFLTYPIMRRYGDLRRTLRSNNGLIGDMDTLIASTAIEHGLAIVTADEDFRRVPELQVRIVPRRQLSRRQTSL